ncbi:hypothetical protein CPC08DRAFT_756203 [Agrocybe pediades]|nr:hypothetical protein CPC08DRAFT_756203 [Agrocybe pediades]
MPTAGSGRVEVSGDTTHMEANTPMGPAHDTIALFTSNISRHILQLALADRQILTALLRWDPSVSERLTRALRILRDLEGSVQQEPLIWAEVATINIRLDSLSALIAQVAPRSNLLMGHSRSRSSTETSLFHNAQQIMITGGSFTIHSAQNTPIVNTSEIDGESSFCPIRRMLREGSRTQRMLHLEQFDGASGVFVLLVLSLCETDCRVPEASQTAIRRAWNGVCTVITMGIFFFL